jgi:DNA gyrase subunit A
LKKSHKRRTTIASPAAEPEFSAKDFIVAEDTFVLLSRDGWVKRQKEVRDLAATRLREGDRVLSCVVGSTQATVVFFSNYATAYTCRIADIPATTGYGEPIQKLFKLKDGEAILSAYSLDPRLVGDLSDKDEGYYPETFAVAASADGYALCFGLGTFVEPSTRSGRRFARPARGAEVIAVEIVHGEETLIAATSGRRALLCPVREVNYLSGPGRGVQLIRLGSNDRVLGVKAAVDDRDTLTVKGSLGGEQRINTAKYEVTSRGGKGREVIKRGHLTEVIPDTPAAPDLPEDEPQA